MGLDAVDAGRHHGPAAGVEGEVNVGGGLDADVGQHSLLVHAERHDSRAGLRQDLSIQDGLGASQHQLQVEATLGQTLGALGRRQERVEPGHVLRPADLGEETGDLRQSGRLDVGCSRGHVHPREEVCTAARELPHDMRDCEAGRGLLRARRGVAKVEHDSVGAALRRTVDGRGVEGRNEELGAADEGKDFGAYHSLGRRLTCAGSIA